MMTIYFEVTGSTPVRRIHFLHSLGTQPGLMGQVVWLDLGVLSSMPVYRLRLLCYNDNQCSGVLRDDASPATPLRPAAAATSVSGWGTTS
jgi:hypothetical protein